MSDYQKAAQVRQLLAERANAVTLGLTTRVEACDKQLRALGYSEPKKDAPASPPAGRSIAKKSVA